MTTCRQSVCTNLRPWRVCVTWSWKWVLLIVFSFALANEEINPMKPCGPNNACVMNIMYSAEVNSDFHVHSFKVKKTYINSGRLHLYVEIIDPSEESSPIAFSVVSGIHTETFHLPFRFPALSQGDETTFTYNFVNRTIYPLDDDNADFELSKTQVRLFVSSASEKQYQAYRFSLSLGSPFFVFPGLPLTMNDLSPSHPALVCLTLQNGWPVGEDGGFFFARVESPDEICASVTFHSSKRPLYVLSSASDEHWSPDSDNGLCDLFSDDDRICLPSTSIAHQSADRKAGKVFTFDALKGGRICLTVVVKPEDSTCGIQTSRFPNDESRKKSVTFSLDLMSTGKKKYLFYFFGIPVALIISSVALIVISNRMYYEKLLLRLSAGNDMILLVDNATSTSSPSGSVSVWEYFRRATSSSEFMFMIFATASTISALPVSSFHPSVDDDLCYINFECAFPLWATADGFRAPNVKVSNLAYVIFGIAFCVVVKIRNQKMSENLFRKFAIYSKRSGYFLGVSLTLQGLISSVYHFCPNERSLSLDVIFMLVMAVLSLCFLNRLQLFFHSASPTKTTRKLDFFPYSVVLHASMGIFWLLLPPFPSSKTILAGLFMLTSPFLSFILYYEECFESSTGTETNIIEDSAGQHLRATLSDLPSLILARVRLLVLSGRTSSVVGSSAFICEMLTIFFTFILALIVINSDGFVSLPFYVVLNTVIFSALYPFYFLRRTEIIGVASSPIFPISFKALLVLLVAAGSSAVSALICYNMRPSDFAINPAQSRRLNTPCLNDPLAIFDLHDMWHFLSASSAFYFFFLLLVIEDVIFIKLEASGVRKVSKRPEELNEIVTPVEGDDTSNVSSTDTSCL